MGINRRRWIPVRICLIYIYIYKLRAVGDDGFGWNSKQIESAVGVVRRFHPTRNAAPTVERVWRIPLSASVNHSVSTLSVSVYSLAGEPDTPSSPTNYLVDVRVV